MPKDIGEPLSPEQISEFREGVDSVVEKRCVRVPTSSQLRAAVGTAEPVKPELTHQEFVEALGDSAARNNNPPASLLQNDGLSDEEFRQSLGAAQKRVRRNGESHSRQGQAEKYRQNGTLRGDKAR